MPDSRVRAANIRWSKCHDIHDCQASELDYVHECPSLCRRIRDLFVLAPENFVATVQRLIEGGHLFGLERRDRPVSCFFSSLLVPTFFNLAAMFLGVKSLSAQYSQNCFTFSRSIFLVLNAPSQETTNSSRSVFSICVMIGS